MALADYPLEIIELKGRPLDEVIPILRPFAGADGTITGMNNQLILRVAPERMNDIRRILAKIDRPPHRLMIYVRQGLIGSDDRSRLAAGANIGVGDDGRIRIGAPTPKESVTVRAIGSRTRERLDSTQQVQTLEGEPAFIAAGTAYPIATQRTYPGRGGTYGQYGYVYRNAATGFYVLPQLNGDRVTLDINPFMDRPGKHRGTFDIQQARTRVSGSLGDWIPIGGVDQSANNSRTGILHRATTRSREDRQILLRVERLD